MRVTGNIGVAELGLLGGIDDLDPTTKIGYQPIGPRVPTWDCTTDSKVKCRHTGLDPRRGRQVEMLEVKPLEKCYGYRDRTKVYYRLSVSLVLRLQ